MADISVCFLAFLYLCLPFLFFFSFLFSAVIQRTNGERFLFDDSGPCYGLLVQRWSCAVISYSKIQYRQYLGIERMRSTLQGQITYQISETGYYSGKLFKTTHLAAILAALEAQQTRATTTISSHLIKGSSEGRQKKKLTLHSRHPSNRHHHGGSSASILEGSITQTVSNSVQNFLKIHHL